MGKQRRTAEQIIGKLLAKLHPSRDSSKSLASAHVIITGSIILLFAVVVTWLVLRRNPTITPPQVTPEHAEMLTDLDSDSAGGINAQEIESAEKRIATKYGSKAARRALLEVLVDRAAHLTSNAVRWLERHTMTTSARVGDLQRILRCYLYGSQFVDANEDGRIDANDFVLAKDSSGCFEVRQVGQVLADRVRIGVAIVNVCRAMARAEDKFGTASCLICSPVYWGVSWDPEYHDVNPAVRPSEAVNDIFEHPSQYSFGSADAVTFVYVKAILDLIGPKDFDRVADGLQMGPTVLSAFFENNVTDTGSGDCAAVQGRRAQFKPGDVAYFYNANADNEARRTRGAAQHAVYLGGDQWYAHPLGIVREKAIIDYLNRSTIAGASKEAKMTNVLKRLEPSILAEDKDPD